MLSENLNEMIQHRRQWVKGVHRGLVDHRHLLATITRQTLWVELEYVFPFVVYPPFGDLPGSLDEIEYAHPEGCLPRAGLSYQTQRVPCGRYLERNAIYRVFCNSWTEIVSHAQVRDFEKRGCAQLIS